LNISCDFNEGSEAVVEIVERLKIDELLNEGFALQEQGHYADAIHYFSEVIGMEPGHSVAYFRRGISHCVLEQHELAIKDYTEAIQLSPGFFAAYNNRGNAYYRLGRYELAIKDYEEAMRLDPNDEGACHNLASALERIDTNKALKAWGRYLQMSKGAPYGKGWIEDVLKIKEDSKSSPS
jgi:tetratricopeptide (TPR) repeat protein